jgi:hypothetical protein
MKTCPSLQCSPPSPARAFAPSRHTQSRVRVDIDQIRELPRIARIRIMPLPRTIRSFATSFTLAAFLLCYLTGAALAWQGAGSGDEIATALATCHGVDQHGAPRETARGACDDAQYVSDSQKLLITSPVAAGEVCLFIQPPPARAVAVADGAPTVPAGAFPPLRLLHCRLLN